MMIGGNLENSGDQRCVTQEDFGKYHKANQWSKIFKVCTKLIDKYLSTIMTMSINFKSLVGFIMQPPGLPKG